MTKFQESDGSEHDESHYDEQWVAIVGDNEYVLDKKQAQVLNDAISKGRGIVQFKSFIINIPFLKEFYLHERTLKSEFKIKPPETEDEKRYREYAEMSPIQREIVDKKRRKATKEAFNRLKILNKQIRERSVIKTRPLTQEKFEKRRNELLEQSKKI